MTGVPAEIPSFGRGQINDSCSQPTSILFESLPSLISLTRSSEGGRYNSSGVYVWESDNVPRFDHIAEYNPYRGLMVEPERTNYASNSTDPSSWSPDGVSVDSGYDAPDGSIDAIRLTVTDPNIGVIANETLLPSVDDYCISSFVYDGNRETILILGVNIFSGYITHKDVHIDGRKFLVANNAPEKIAAYSGYYNGLLNAEPGDQWTTWGMQIENLPAGEAQAPTSLIRTTGSSATRAEDVVTFNDTSNSVEILYYPLDSYNLQREIVNAGNQPSGIYGHWVRVRQF